MKLTYGEKRAVNEIESILSSQWKNGMLPHIRFLSKDGDYSPSRKDWGVTKRISGNNNFDTSGIIQPPMIGYSLYEIYSLSENKDEILFYIDKFYKKVKKYHDFLFRERDPQKENLIVVLHPWETGTDNTPYKDELIDRTIKVLRAKKIESRIKKRKDTNAVNLEYRPTDRGYECFGRLIGLFLKYNYNQQEIIKRSPFVVQDVLFNSILAASTDSLSRLAFLLSRKFKGTKKEEFYKEESKKQKELYEKVRNAIQAKLFDEDQKLFYSYDLVGKKLLKIDTIHSLTPLFGGCATKKQAEGITRKIFSKSEFNPGIMVTTTSVKMKQFDGLRYWRGAVWPAPMNWLIYQGLRKYDKNKAKELKEKTIEIMEEGFKLTKKEAGELASSLMEYNSYKDCFTIPSKLQYHHGWFWDSCFAAIGWVSIPNKIEKTDFWARVESDFMQLKKKVGSKEAGLRIKGEFKVPLFNEYYAAETKDQNKIGDPIGSIMMTWAAALYLNLKLN